MLFRSEKKIKVPPCFIIVCQNTAISKLVYDFISGFQRKNDDGTTTLENGRLGLFRNFDARTGAVISGPPTRPLGRIDLEIRHDGQIWALGRHP